MRRRPVLRVEGEGAGGGGRWGWGGHASAGVAHSLRPHVHVQVVARARAPACVRALQLETLTDRLHDARERYLREMESVEERWDKCKRKVIVWCGQLVQQRLAGMPETTLDEASRKEYFEFTTIRRTKIEMIDPSTADTPGMSTLVQTELAALLRRRFGYLQKVFARYVQHAAHSARHPNRKRPNGRMRPLTGSLTSPLAGTKYSMQLTRRGPVPLRPIPT